MFVLEMLALLGGCVVAAGLCILLMVFLLDLPDRVRGWVYRFKTRKGN